MEINCHRLASLISFNLSPSIETSGFELFDITSFSWFMQVRKSFLSHKGLSRHMQDLTQIELYKATMTDFSSAAQEAYKKASSLDNKVKKWQSVPEDILERSASLKNMATALIASATTFSMSKKALHTDKMETALNSLAAQGIEARDQSLTFCLLV